MKKLIIWENETRFWCGSNTINSKANISMTIRFKGVRERKKKKKNEEKEGQNPPAEAKKRKMRFPNSEELK